MTRSFLSPILITAGLLIILAFVGLGVAPYFIDWNHYRAEIEQEISDFLGEEVTIQGEITAKLLPSPKVSLAGLHIGPEETPVFTTQSLKADLDFASLLGLKIKVEHLRLEKPSLVVHRDEQGAYRVTGFDQLERRQALMEKVGIASLEIFEGAIVLQDSSSSRPLTVDSITGLASLGSLWGPYTFDGSGRWKEERFDTSLEMDKLSEKGARTRLRFSQGSQPMVITLRGLLKLDQGIPDFQGKVSLQWYDLTGDPLADQDLPPLWQANSPFVLQSQGFDLPELALQLGDSLSNARFQGSVFFDWSARPSYRLTLGAAHIQIGEQGAPPSAEGSLLPVANFVSQQFSHWPSGLKGRIQITVPSMAVGGELVRDFAIDLDQDGQQWSLRQLSAKIPGGGDLLFSVNEAKNEGDLEGEIKFEASNTTESLQWLFGERGRAGEALTRFVPSSLSSHFEKREGLWVFSDLSLLVGSTFFSGTLEQEMKNGKREVRIAGQSPFVDFDFFRKQVATKDFEAVNEIFPFDRLSLTLAVQRANLYDAKMRNLSLQTQINGKEVQLKRLFVEDLQGLSLDASGRFITDLKHFSGALTLDLKGEKTDLLEQWVDWPRPSGAFVDGVEKRAQAFSSIDLSTRLDVEQNHLGSSLKAEVDGKVGDSKLKLYATYTDETPTIDLTSLSQGQLSLEYFLDHENGRALLAAASGRPWGEGEEDLRIRGELSGKIGGEFHWTQETFALGGWSLVEGQIDQFSPAFWSEAAWHSGSNLNIQFDQFEIATLLQSTIGFPAIPSAESKVSGSLQLVSNQQSLRFEEVNLKLGETGWQGSAAYNKEEERLTSNLHIGQLSLPGLVEIMGQVDLTDKDGSWSSSPFESDFELPFTIEAEITTDSLLILDNFSGRGANLSLVYKDGEVQIDLQSVSLAGGEIKGSLLVGSRESTTTYIDLSAELIGLHSEDLVWRWNGHPIIDGELDGALFLSGQGISPAGLASSLSGSAHLKVQPGKIRGLSRSLLSEVQRSVDAGAALTENSLKDLVVQHLDASALDFSSIEGRFSIESGVVRSQLARISGLPMQVDISLIADLGSLALDSEWILLFKDKDVSSPPRLGLTFTGPLKMPKREVDISPLQAYLNLRAFEKNIDEIKRLEAEIEQDKKPAPGREATAPRSENLTSPGNF